MQIHRELQLSLDGLYYMLSIIWRTCLDEDSEAVEESAREQDEDDVGGEKERGEAGPGGE